MKYFLIFILLIITIINSIANGNDSNIFEGQWVKAPCFRISEEIIYGPWKEKPLPNLKTILEVRRTIKIKSQLQALWFLFPDNSYIIYKREYLQFARELADSKNGFMKKNPLPKQPKLLQPLTTEWRMEKEATYLTLPDEVKYKEVTDSKFIYKNNFFFPALWENERQKQ